MIPCAILLDLTRTPLPSVSGSELIRRVTSAVVQNRPEDVDVKSLCALVSEFDSLALELEKVPPTHLPLMKRLASRCTCIRRIPCKFPFRQSSSVHLQYGRTDENQPLDEGTQHACFLMQSTSHPC